VGKIRDYKIAMLRVHDSLAPNKRFEVPKGFAVTDRWGKAAGAFAEQLCLALGLPPSKRLSKRLRAVLEPYRPITYRYLDRELWLAAGHAGYYNQMPLLPSGWESKEAIRVVNELLEECRRRGARNVHLVPHKFDLAESIEYVLAHANKGAYCWELHYNAGPASVRGWMTSYSAGNRRSWQMARTIASEIKQAGFPLWGDGIIASATIAKWNGWDDIGWHRRPNAAGLVPNLLEMGFGTSRYDTYWWKAPRRRKALISAMADAAFPPR
jgi:hypothetical protein